MSWKSNSFYRLMYAAYRAGYGDIAWARVKAAGLDVAAFCLITGGVLGWSLSNSQARHDVDPVVEPIQIIEPPAIESVDDQGLADVEFGVPGE